MSLISVLHFHELRINDDISDRDSVKFVEMKNHQANSEKSAPLHGSSVCGWRSGHPFISF